jgi:hypothetical protein
MIQWSDRQGVAWRLFPRFTRADGNVKYDDQGQYCNDDNTGEMLIASLTTARNKEHSTSSNGSITDEGNRAKKSVAI